MSVLSQQPVAGADQAQLAQHIPGAFADDEDTQAISSENSLSDALHARRAEFTKPRQIRIKVGSWNVAAKKGTEKDVAGWFINGEGVAESLSGLTIRDVGTDDDGDDRNAASRENITHQEERFERKACTLPQNDSGSLPGGDNVDVYVLGLQEIVDVSSPTEALRPYGDAAVPAKYKDALQAALPDGYQMVADQQLTGLYILIFASPTIAPDVRSVSSQSVGTGLMGYMGNKGAVITRLILGESTRLVFVNCHLAAGLGKTELERRNWDASQIVSRTRFAPIVDSLGAVSDVHERIGDEDFTFWFGDLNYRLEGIPGEDVRRLLMLHTRNEYDLNSRAGKRLEEKLAKAGSPPVKEDDDHSRDPDAESIRTSSTGDRRSMQSAHTWASTDDTILDPSEDPASLQTTISSLLPHDELHQQIKQRRMFHDGWQEGPITFLPTYKYDVGSVGIFDSGDKRRGPSWCDRILFRTRKDLMSFQKKLQEEEDAKKRDQDLRSQGIDKAADDEDTLFEYDPDADADEEYNEDEDVPNATALPPQTVITKEEYADIIQLQYYVSHQRVLSSDHKPLTALFSVKYDAVVPELKAKVHQEVVRDLDRAENESRPHLTVVVENSQDDEGDSQPSINCGPVRFAEPKTRSITLANTGRVPARFGFLLRPVGAKEEPAIAKEWVSLLIDRPSEASKAKGSKKAKHDLDELSEQYTLHPGETCNVDVTIDIRKKSLVKKFNEGEEVEDVVVLRVVDGRDHFLFIRGIWQKSFLYQSINSLCRIPEGGVRAQMDNTGESSSDDAIARSGPRELFRLTEKCEVLVERTLAEQTMLIENKSPEELPWFKYSGWPFVPESWLSESSERESLCFHVREALDNDQEIDKRLPPEANSLQRLEAVASTLVDFLESLEDGIISKGLWTEVDNEFLSQIPTLSPMDVDDKRAKVLEILAISRSHSVSFVFLTSMMGRIIQEVSLSTQEMPSLARANSDLPKTSKASVRRKELASDQLVARRQVLRKEYAALFSELMIRYPQLDNNKASLAQLDRGRTLLETFLESSTD